MFLRLCRVLACVEAQSLLVEHIKNRQFNDENLCIIRDKMLKDEAKEAILGQEAVLRIKD